ncbi:hypothetical protein, partial [Accumulibacter sp.]|uniref:hypothetical protein n=1 Tax=Accumulibacter sp. TaxID=2053492 RepID=UPI0035AF258E
MNQTSDRELLTILLGEQAESYPTHSLAELFGLRRIRPGKTLQVAEEAFSYALPSRLMAARELLRRALA